MPHWNVKLFCDACGKTFWEGNLIGWAIELSKKTAPKWFNLAVQHELLPDHTLKIEYPSQTVNFFELLPLEEMRA